MITIVKTQRKGSKFIKEEDTPKFSNLVFKLLNFFITKIIYKFGDAFDCSLELFP